MIQGVSLFEREFIPESQEKLPREEQTYFGYGPLTAKDRAFILNEFSRTITNNGRQEQLSFNGTATLEIIKRAARWSKNFRNEKGEDIPVPKSRTDEKGWDNFLNQLPSDLAIEFGNAIFNASSIKSKVEEVGESERQPPSPTHLNGQAADETIPDAASST